MEQVAWNLLVGDIVKQDVEKAHGLFEELSLTGYPGGQMGLGFMYASGIHVNSSQARALVYYTFAALGGPSWAQMALGYRYWSGVSVATSCESALAFYRKVA